MHIISIDHEPQLYEFELSDQQTVRGWIDKHFTPKGNRNWPTMVLTDGRLVGTHISKLRPVEGEPNHAA